MPHKFSGTDISFIAVEDLSGMKFRFVHQVDNDSVDQLDSGSEVPAGILQNAPALGKIAIVRIAGTSDLVMNAAVAVNTLLKADVSATDNGKGDAADTEGDFIVARCIKSPAADDIGKVILTGISKF